ncbi:MAG: twin-arginine translocase TatA/TatE family subunit [Thermoflexales bacterium]
MNGTVFGVGPLEVLLIGILILLVFGPERLPEFTRGLGVALRRLRESYIAFTREFKDELQPIAQDIHEVTRELRQEVEAIREAADLRTVLNPYAEAISQAATVEASASTAPSSPFSPSSNGYSTPTEGSSSAQTSDADDLSISPFDLPSDNPWAQVNAPVRTDALDDDNPWRG